MIPRHRSVGKKRHSAGILVYRHPQGEAEVLLVHPGGPFWNKRDLGAWSIPKGELSPDEDAETAARREFTEETGWTLDQPLARLGQCRQRGGKIVEAFAAEASFDVKALASNLFEMEWPPHSGRRQSFPEIDCAEWFSLPDAEKKIIDGQRPLLARLQALILEYRRCSAPTET